MFSTLVSATFVFLLSASGALAGFSIATVNLTECSPAHITWSEATGPYNLAVVPESDPCDTVLVDLGDHAGLSMTWPNVSVPAGTKVLLSLLDANDEEAWSGEITVQPGTNCSASSVASSASGASADGATTLVLSNTVSGDDASSTSAVASALGAANAGIVPAGSGALSTARLSVGATVFASVVAAAAMIL